MHALEARENGCLQHTILCVLLLSVGRAHKNNKRGPDTF